jgi:hypothetical protein
MMAWHNVRWTGTVAVLSGLAVVAAACSPAARPDLTARYSDGTPAPIALACEPNQRALVRQVIVNGTVQAQLECASAAASVAGFAATVPVTYAPAPGNYASALAPIANTQFVRTAAEPVVVSRPATQQRVAFPPAARRVAAARPARSVVKSAVIIGSSAGVGAGIGAALGGKQGAGIGALVGGGGAALWDQITRRK